MIKYGVRLLLWTNDPNTKGFYPIYICVTISRKRAYIATGIFIPKKQWDDAAERIKDSHPLANVYNPDLQERKARVIRFIGEKQMAGASLTATEVKGQFSRRDLHNIFQFIEHFIDECRGKKTDSTLENYRKHALRLELFHGSKNLAFEEITAEFLGRYERHLRSPTNGSRAVDGNYIHALWRTLKTFFNAARKRKIISCYPFDQYENPVYEGPEKPRLTLEELRAWEKHINTIKDAYTKQAAIWFLFGCYTGLRVSDWALFDEKKHIVGDRVKIRAKKNGEWVTMPISAPLRRNLKRMAAVPFTSPEQVLNREYASICEALGIDKHLTHHCARHTFAVTVCAERGISAETCAELMGITIATCVQAYYRVTSAKVDREALAAWKGM